MDWYHMTTKVHDRQKAKGLSIELRGWTCFAVEIDPSREWSILPPLKPTRSRLNLFCSSTRHNKKTSRGSDTSIIIRDFQTRQTNTQRKLMVTNAWPASQSIKYSKPIYVPRRRLATLCIKILQRCKKVSINKCSIHPPPQHRPFISVLLPSQLFPQSFHATPMLLLTAHPCGSDDSKHASPELLPRR